MKKYLSFLLMMFILPMAVFAQDEIIIGTGTSAGSNGPMSNNYVYSWCETIYPNSYFEGECLITKMAYQVKMAASGSTFQQLKIYMGETTAANHPGWNSWTPMSDLTLVYDHTNVAYGRTTGWNEFELDVPFSFSATKNLVIVVAKECDDTFSASTFCYTTQSKSLLFRRSDSNPAYMEHPGTANASSAASGNMANLKLTLGDIGGCPKVTAVEVENVTSTSATITWTYNSGDAWDIYVSDDGIAPIPETTPTATATTASYSISGLLPSTNYKAYVRTNCGDGEVSAWRDASFYTNPDFLGNGTAANPYKLYTLEDIEMLRSAMADGWNTKDRHFQVQNDIVGLTNPIGTADNEFRGEFDGNNCSITVNISDGNYGGYKALFAVAGSSANIHDLTVKGSVSSANSYCAGLVARVVASSGDNNDVLITNCTNQAEINCMYTHCGGIVGYNAGTASESESNLIIANCTNKGIIHADYDYCGGIAGRIGTNDIVNNCTNTAAVSGNYRYVSGIAGFCPQMSIVRNCVNKGGITATGTSYDNYAAGIVGNNYGGFVQNCYNIGSVSGAKGYVGGIVGCNSFDGNEDLIANVYNAGTIMAPDATTSGSIVGYNAGFEGYGSATVEYAYYKEGTFGAAYGSTSVATSISNIASFTQNGTSCILSTLVYSTTDLKTALNSWRNNTTEFNSWYDDIYGNNQSLPTFDVGTVPGLHVSPDPLAFGPCPIGAWTEPRQLTLTNNGSNDVVISSFDYTDSNWFTFAEEPETPLTIIAGESNVLSFTTNPNSNPEPGIVNDQLVVFWNSRNTSIASITATAYEAVSPDIFEMAMVVENNGNIIQDATQLYNNYRLPGSTIDGPDAVYKLNYSTDVLFNAAVIAGNSGKIAIYSEDFNGFGGPSTDNYYTGTEFSVMQQQYPVSYGGDGPIANLTLRPGTYYLVASSTSASFTVQIDAQEIPLPTAPELIAPAYGAHDIATPVELQWHLGQFTTEYRVLLGMEFPPVNVLTDWTDNLEESIMTETLSNNRNYFWRIEERNATGTVQGDIWAFTTSLNIPQNLVAADTTVYCDDVVALSWQPVADRGHRGYNVYQDNVKVNTEVVFGTSFTVNNLNYNMSGTTFNVSAVYDEGESSLSNGVTVYVSGDGFISGNVYELDGETPIANATVTIDGIDEFGIAHQYVATTDSDGAYRVTAKVGTAYQIVAVAEGYQATMLPETVGVSYGQATSNVDIVLTEIYKPVVDVVAEEIENDEDKVHIYWGYGHLDQMIEDFETGDFSQYNWNNESTFPWELTQNNPYEGVYCIKSGNRNVSNSTSSIEVTVDIPHSGKMSFFYKISCEMTYDRGFFYIDGVQKDVWSGVSQWSQREYGVSEGTHTFKWAYTKDGTYNEEDDCLYVDFINFIYDAPSAQSRWLYYDDGEYYRSTGAGNNADRPYYWGIMLPTEDLFDYNGYALTKVQMYDHQAGEYTLNIYMGGSERPIDGELVATKVLNMTGTNTMFEIELDEPIAINPAQNLWITFATQDVPYPAAASHNTGNSNGRWASLSNNLWWDITHWNIYDITWMIRGYVTDDYGRTAVLNDFTDNASHLQFEGYGGTENTPIAFADAETPHHVGLPETVRHDTSRSLQYYDIFLSPRDEENTDNMIATGITDTTYIWNGWEDVETGVYKFGVRSLYDGNRGYSPIVWSNNLPKNMYTTVSVSASTNSGDSVNGAVVNLENISEPELELVYEARLDETGMFEWAHFRKGTYIANLTLNGFGSCFENTEMEINDATSLNCVMTELTASDTTLFVSSTGFAKWEPIVHDEPMLDLCEDFETGDFSKFPWDNSVSAFPWIISSENPYEGHYCIKSSNSGVALSQSAIEVTVDLPCSGTMSFYALVLGEVYAGGSHYDYGMFYIDGSAAGDLYTETVWTRKTYHVSAGTHTFKWIYKKDSSVNPEGDYMALDKIQFVSESKDDRSIESYDIKLDGTLVANVTVPYFQHDVTNMSAGEIHTTSIINNYTTGSSEPNNYTWTYVPCDEYVGVNNVSVEAQGRNAFLTWTMPNNIGTGDEFSYNFESGDLSGWTTIDADGDGHNWFNSSTMTDPGVGHSSQYCVMSESYDLNTNIALHPDNYLVSPRVNLGSRSILTFYASAQDEEYADEHFGVAISTSGNENPNDFTTIAEWDMTVKKVQRYGERGYRQGNWYQFTVNLGQYSGQQCYIALRHFNSTDNFVINIDDVVLGNSSKGLSNMIFDQSQFVTNAGVLNGYDVSAMQGAQSQYGPNANAASPHYVADDFTIGSQSTINEIEVYGYQTGSDTISTFTGLYLAIYDGNPKNGGQLIAGNLNTNVMTTTKWTHCYRTNSGMTGTTRPIMSITASNLNITLPAGQYWLVWGMEGSLSSGPWAQPVAIEGETATGDALYFTTEWQEIIDDGCGDPYGLAFKISGQNGNNSGTQASGEYLGVFVYRNGELLTTEPLRQNYYTDLGLDQGDYTYGVRLVYGDELLGEQDSLWYAMSCAEEAEISFDIICDAPYDLYGEYDVENQIITMTWPYQPILPVQDWLYYDDGTNVSAVGTGDGLYWGIMFPTEMLQEYAGTYLTKIMIYDYEACEATITIYYNGNDAPQIPVHAQDIQLLGKHSWQEIELTSPIPVNETMNLWVTVHSDSDGYPAAMCNNTGDPNGRWVSHDGNSWIDIAQEGMPYTWMLRAFVTEEVKNGAKTSRELEHFNIYRSSDNINYEVIGTVPAGDVDQWTYSDIPGEGTWYYQVRAYYVSGDEYCESDPAATYEDPTQDYLVVSIWGINENHEVSLYPNPTNGNLNIEAQNMNRIIVVSVLGQVILDIEIEGDEYQIDMTQFNAGVYMVRIATENGVSTQRVTVVK